MHETALHRDHEGGPAAARREPEDETRPRPMTAWPQQTRSLSQRMLLRVLFVAGVSSVLFGLLFLGLYRSQLEAERAEASLNLNRMLQATWENAMLKRDVEGLRDIVSGLGQLHGIRDVLILAPDGEVRFASNPGRLGAKMPELLSVTAAGMPVSRFQLAGHDAEVLRSINPVPNREPCTPCHGPVAAKPVNGVLVLDYDAAPIRQRAMLSASLFLLAGSLTIVLILYTTWRMLQRHVLAPIARLDAVAGAVAAGDLRARAPVDSDDEIGRTARCFNSMAEHLERQLALQTTQRRYLQDVLDGLPDGVRVIRQSDLAVLGANQAYCQQLGRQDVVGQPCHAASHARPTPCPPTMVLCPAAELKQAGDALKCQHRHCRADGTEFAVEVHARLIEVDTQDGRQRYIVESVRDLSQAARISQEQRLSELGMLAAGIAHEIHNPLGSIRLAVEGMARRLRTGTSDAGTTLDYLDIMNDEIDRCIEVTRRLLLLSRPPQAQAQPVDVNLALADTLSLLAFDAASRGIEQRLETHPAGPRVLADDSDLRMVILNLVQNAHHAMPRGGHLHARSGIAGDDVFIEIIDTGVGIAAEDLPHIFDPFFSKRADRVAGTGLGLNICKSMVDHYWGRIEVNSRPGAGSTFRVVLPGVS